MALFEASVSTLVGRVGFQWRRIWAEENASFKFSKACAAWSVQQKAVVSPRSRDVIGPVIRE